MDNFTLILSVNNTFKYYFKYCLLNFLSLLAFYTRTTASLSSPWTQTFCSDHSAQWTKYFLSPLKRFFFITLACLFGGGGKFHNLHLEVRSNVKKLVLSFYHVSLWGSNSVNLGASVLALWDGSHWPIKVFCEYIYVISLLSSLCLLLESSVYIFNYQY